MNKHEGGSKHGQAVTGTMARFSILSVMLLVLLFAVALSVFIRLHEEAFFYIAGPVLGSLLAAHLYPSDRSAHLKGGAIGGLCQGVISIIAFERGYIFRDIEMITGPLFLASLAVHLLSGLAFGGLLFLMLRWSRPRPLSETKSKLFPLDVPCALVDEREGERD